MRPSASTISVSLRGTGCMRYQETGKANGAFRSTNNGGSASFGREGTLCEARLRTIMIDKEKPMGKNPNIHPGEILSEEFLKPMGLSAYRLSKGANIDQTRISEIIRGKRSITADTALRLARFFGN